MIGRVIFIHIEIAYYVRIITYRLFSVRLITKTHLRSAKTKYITSLLIVLNVFFFVRIGTRVPVSLGNDGFFPTVTCIWTCLYILSMFTDYGVKLPALVVTFLQRFCKLTPICNIRKYCTLQRRITSDIVHVRFHTQ